jgi:CubicO group peptidase (beta-lactamase class C family)
VGSSFGTRLCGVLATLILSTSFPGTAFADALSPAQVTRIGAIVQTALAQQHLVGVEVAVGRNGTTLFTKGYGLRDKAQNLPVTASTVFPTVGRRQRRQYCSPKSGPSVLT